MNLDSKSYKKYAKERAKKSPLAKDSLMAFLIGGAICMLGQAIMIIYKAVGVPDDMAKSLVPVTLIFLAALFTGIGIFDNLAKIAGAGTLVPITGFANAVVSPAIDNKSEGFIMGVGAKMFVVAGPVIVYGIISSVLYGVVYYIVGLF
ncbi:stage V sporulation protein AC [Candidatus Apopatosoma intestinale]|jgi:stage V sporulation protein AC|nr:stage V sporulation protein AC [Candidatus Apopatosoma intestinale]CCZ21207.1 stage V sporulation protein AC [Candidatus Apopatosoma intestinale]